MASSDCEQSSNFLSPHPAQFERAIPFRESKGPLGPFKATKIWHDLIDHLKSKVELKRRRHKMKSVDSCFTGTDAVDVVLHFLLNDRDTFSADLSREKAVKVCQMLMQRKVFASAVDKPNIDKAFVFEDSSGKLYQFIGEHAVGELQAEAAEEDDENECNTTQNITRSSDKLRLSEHFEPEEEPNSQSTENPSGSVSPTASVENLPYLNVTPGRPVRTLTNEEVEDVWREVALTQLLTLVELTFLDGILSEDKYSLHQKLQDHLIISNAVARNWRLPLIPGLTDARPDPLLQSAVECIQHLPKGLNYLSEPVFRRRGMEAKLWAKDIIVKHYTSLEEMLLPQKYLELHMAILNLVLTDNLDTALSALQLYVILLPCHTREELYRLLRFMRSLAADSDMRLDSQVSNEVAILVLLTDHIFKHKLLASNVAQKLVQFMMNNVNNIFTVPKPIRKKVTVKLFQLKTGKPLLECESSYCDRVSKEEYVKQSKDCTEESLVNLMNTVLDDTNISLKEKKHRLKQFQKSYPQLYERNFDGML
ncbi:hypothetical protein BsWGS_12965 [Bradybaena similaris]